MIRADSTRLTCLCDLLRNITLELTEISNDELRTKLVDCKKENERIKQYE
jgi:hypothetical protein